VIAETEVPATLPAGFRLGKYAIRRLLGAGGMGAVYEGHHTEIGKRVAIKVLAPELAAAPGARARFLREAQLTSRIRHPNIVAVHDVGSEEGYAFIVMELLEGEDLATRLERGGQLAVQELADIMLAVCSAVAEAHRVGITHRDLKPQNIFLARAPQGIEPKVLDFGISKGSDTKPGALTGTGMIGTPYYFAPEQILDAQSAGPASDQYALGVILYECLSGQRPYEGDNLFVVFKAIVDATARPIGELRAGVPGDLQGIVARAMHKEASGRFASAAALGRALLPFASARQRSVWAPGLGVEAAAPGAVAPPAKPTPRGTMVLPPERSRPVTPPPARPTTRQDFDSTYDLRPRWRAGRFLAVAVGAAVIAGGALFVLRDRASFVRRTVEPVVQAPAARTPAVVPPAVSPVIEPVDVPPPVHASVLDLAPEAEPTPRPRAKVEQPHPRSHEKRARATSRRKQKRLARPQPAQAEPGPIRTLNLAPIIE